MEDSLIFSELHSLRGEQQDYHNIQVRKTDELSDKITQGFTNAASALAAHELHDLAIVNALDVRIRPLEQIHQTLKWATGTAIVALCAGAADFFFNHLHWKL